MGLKNLFKLPKLPSVSEVSSAFKSEAINLKEVANSAEVETNFSKPILSWKAPLFLQNKKPIWWYLVFGLIATGLFVYGILSGGWTLSVAISLFVGVYYIFSDQEPPVYDIVISEMGVKVGSKVYPYSMFKTFWIDYHFPHTRDLHFVPNNNYKYELTIQLMDVDPSEVKATLRKFLPEWVDRRKTFTESLIKIIGI